MNKNNKLNYIIFFVLSFIIILGYSILFPPPKQKQPGPVQTPSGELVQKEKSPEGAVEKEVKEETIFSKIDKGLDPFEVSNDLISVKSSLFNGTIDPLGSRIVEWKLRNFNETTGDDTIKYDLIKDSPPNFNIEIVTDSINVPNPIPFSYTGSRDIILTDSSIELEFNWQSAQGLIISKNYSINPNSYLISSTLTIKNNTDKTIKQKVVVDTFSKSLDASGYRKSKEFIALVSEEVEKQSDSPKEKKQYSGKIGWFGFLDKYFLYTFLPETGAESKVDFYSLGGLDLVRAVYSYPSYSLKPGNTNIYKSKLYLGPLDLGTLKQAGSQLGSAMEYCRC
jgi:YidC/Oxa1 family membrane protein insertase